MKKILITLALALSAIVALAATDPYNEAIDLKITKWNGQYALGENIVVTMEIDSTLAGQKLRMTVLENRKEVVNKVIEAKNGVIFDKAYNESMSVVVKVAPASGKPLATSIGAVAGYEGFRPGADCPKDFMKFWEKQKKQLRKLPIKAEIDTVKSNPKLQKGYMCVGFELNMPDSLKAIGYMVKPENAAPKSLPIVLHLHGAGVRTAYSTIGTAQTYAKKGNGCIGIDLNALGLKNDMPKEFYIDLEKGSLKGYSTRPIVDHKSFLFRNMFLRLVRTLDYFTQDPAWDGRILVYGSSQGGAQSAAAACLDQRVGAAVLIVPAAHDMLGSKAGHGNSWMVKNMKEGTYNEDVIPYYDGANFLRFYKGKLYVEAGLIDLTCPAPNVISAYNVAASPDKNLYTYPYRPHNEPGGKYRKVWQDNILSAREAFMAEYLK